MSLDVEEKKHKLKKEGEIYSYTLYGTLYLFSLFSTQNFTGKITLYLVKEVNGICSDRSLFCLFLFLCV